MYFCGLHQCHPFFHHDKSNVYSAVTLLSNHRLTFHWTSANKRELYNAIYSRLVLKINSNSMDVYIVVQQYFYGSSHPRCVCSFTDQRVLFKYTNGLTWLIYSSANGFRSKKRCNNFLEILLHTAISRNWFYVNYLQNEYSCLGINFSWVSLN